MEINNSWSIAHPFPTDEELLERFAELSREGNLEQRNTEFLSVQNAANIAGKSPDTIRRWIREGHLRGLSVWRTVMVWEPSLRDAQGAKPLPRGRQHQGSDNDLPPELV